MYQFVSESCYVRPWNFWMACAILFRDVVGGFAENDKVKDDSSRKAIIEKQLVA